MRLTHVFQLTEKAGHHAWGGAERHLRVLLPALARAGHDVEAVVMCTNPGLRIFEGLDEMRRGGVRIVQLDRHSSGHRIRKLPGVASWYLRLFAVLRGRRDRIIHLHLDLIGMPAVAAIARCRAVCTTIHVDHPAWARFFWRWWLRRTDGVFGRYAAISRRVRSHWAVVSGAPLEKIDVIEYGLPEPEDDHVDRRELGLPADAFVIGFVGRLVEQKNVPVLLRALAQMPDAHGCIVGDGPLRSSLEQFSGDLGLRHVHFVDGRENAARLMRAFDVLCLPSWFEGLGLVLIEAMLRGVPCIGSRAGAIPDILEDGRSGLLFDPANPDELAQCISLVRSNASAIRELVDRARQRVRERFSVEQMVQRTGGFYARIQM